MTISIRYVQKGIQRTIADMLLTRFIAQVTTPIELPHRRPRHTGRVGRPWHGTGEAHQEPRLAHNQAMLHPTNHGVGSSIVALKWKAKLLKGEP